MHEIGRGQSCDPRVPGARWRATRLRRLALGLLLLAPAGAGAAPPDGPVPPAIRVSGEAVIEVEPDRASLDVGVVTQARSADAAARTNAERVDAVLRAVRKLLGPNAMLRTRGYSVSPSYRYPREGGKREIVGYVASNVVEVRTGELDRIGAVIDTVTAAGSNQIHALRFSLADEGPARARALERATRQARAKAEAIAAALELPLGRVLRVEEEMGGAVPLRREAMLMQAEQAAATPIEAGELEVRARVLLTVELGGG